MRPLDTNVTDAVAIGDKPTPPALGTRRYGIDRDISGGVAGTIPPAWWFNDKDAELYNLLTELGGTPHATTDNQLATVLAPVNAIDADASDTGTVSTSFLRFLAACTLSQASGANSACIASAGSQALGPYNSVLASVECVANGSASLCAASYKGTVTGINSGVMLSQKASTGDLEVSGDQSMIAACENNGSGDLTVTGDHSATIASEADSTLNNLNDGDNCLNAATKNCSTDSGSGRAANIAADGCVVNATRAILIASQNTELVDNNKVAGGYSAAAITPSGSNQNITWDIDSATGQAGFQGGVAFDYFRAVTLTACLTGAPATAEPKGSLCVDVTNAVLYINTDGTSTGWAAV